MISLFCGWLHSSARTDTYPSWGHSDIIKKQVYGEEDIAALMDFSHIQCGHQLQDIWTYVNSSQGKRIDVYKHQIMARMK